MWQKRLFLSVCISSKIGHIWALSQFSLCTHNPANSLYNYFSIFEQFFSSDGPSIFWVHDSPNNLDNSLFPRSGYPKNTVVTLFKLANSQFIQRLIRAVMGFPVRITETETRNNLFPQWCPLRNKEQKQKQLMDVVDPRGRRRPKFCGVSRNSFLKCRSASESVFAGILDQIFRGFIDSKNVFSDAEVYEIWQIWVLGVKYLTNVCVMYVMMYVVCAGRTDR